MFIKLKDSVCSSRVSISTQSADIIPKWHHISTKSADINVLGERTAQKPTGGENEII